MYTKYFFSIVVAFVMLFTTNTLTAQKNTHSYAVMSQDILKLINKYRTDKGLKALEMDEQIAKVAEKHSMDMATEKVPFGHDGFDARMALLREKIKPVYGWAENVAYGQQTANDVVDSWLHSPAHKKNIEGDYNLSGIGIAKSAGGELYYTHIFINKGAAKNTSSKKK